MPYGLKGKSSGMSALSILPHCPFHGMWGREEKDILRWPIQQKVRI